MNRKTKHKSGHPVAGARSRPRTRAEPGTRMSVLLANPDYLLEGFAEKRCKYIGALSDIPTTADLNDRAYLLHSLDTTRNSGRLPWHLGLENEVSVTISAYNMKIIREDGSGTVLHRLPIHQIACCCYVNDDDQHLLFIRAGDSSLAHCPVHVLVGKKRADAEEVCTILQEVFQLVYTEATVQLLNDSINAGEKGAEPRTTSLKNSQKPSKEPRRQLQESRGVEERDGEEEEEGENDGRTSPEELVQQYMERLHKLLDFKELREFASLLKQYRDHLPVKKFLHQLRDLYGAQRTFLIPDMRSFIPEEDRAFFEAFLIENNLPVDQSASSAATKPHPPPTHLEGGEEKRRGEGGGRKGRRGRNQGAHIADVDAFLADIDSHAERMMDSAANF